MADALVPAEALVPPAVPDPGFASEGELVDVPIALDDTIVEGTEPAPRQTDPDGEATGAVPAPVEPDTVLPATPEGGTPLPDDGTVPPVDPAPGPDPDQGPEGEGGAAGAGARRRRRPGRRRA